MFQVATRSARATALPEANVVSARSAAIEKSVAMGGRGGWLARRIARAATAQQAPQREDERDDQRQREREQAERIGSRMAQRRDRAIDEERRRRDARQQSDDRAEQEVAPANVRCAGDNVDDRERRNG